MIVTRMFLSDLEYDPLTFTNNAYFEREFIKFAVEMKRQFKAVGIAVQFADIGETNGGIVT